MEDEKDGVLTGRTRANKLVHWPRPQPNSAAGRSETRLGEMIHVRITRASPWALRGVQTEAAVRA